MTWFSRLRNWQTDQANGIGIRSDYHDQEDNNFALGINECINYAGLSLPIANIPWGGFQINNLGAGTLRTDACTVAQAQTGLLPYATDTGSTNTYAITISPAITAYAVGQNFRLQVSSTNTGAATLNVSGLGAKPIVKNAATALVSGDILQNQIITVVYDGTSFQLLSPVQGLINQSSSALYAADSGSTGSYAITLVPALASYTNGLVVNFKPNTTNTGATSININGLGSKTIKKDLNTDTAAGDIVGGQIVQLIYDGTNFQMTSPIWGVVNQNGGVIYSVDAGAQNAFALTLSPIPTSYVTGMVVRFKSANNCTGTCTINVNGLGVKNLYKNGTTNLASADILQNQIVEAVYDGTNFQLLSPVSNVSSTSLAIPALFSILQYST